MATPSSITIFIDREIQDVKTPDDQQLKKWARQVIKDYCQTASLSIRLVSQEESALLNEQYRQKTGPTNILSFEFEAPLGMESDVLGDIVLCPHLIEKESAHKDALQAHWAHLLIHGCLHLLGYHHSDHEASQTMEQLEIEYLKNLGYPNPYE